MMSRCAGGLKSWGTCIAISPVRPERIWRQALCGANPISSMTRSTRSRVSSATSGLLFRIRETVAIETPLAAAMSMIVVLATFERVVTRALLGRTEAPASSSDRLSLHGARPHPRQDPALRDDVDEDHGQDREHDVGGHEAPVRPVLPEEVVDRERHGPGARAVEEVERHQELVPDVEDAEDRERDQHRREHREDHPEERAERRAAVDERGLVELARHRLDERV